MHNCSLQFNFSLISFVASRQSTVAQLSSFNFLGLFFLGAVLRSVLDWYYDVSCSSSVAMLVSQEDKLAAEIQKRKYNTGFATCCRSV